MLSFDPSNFHVFGPRAKKVFSSREIYLVLVDDFRCSFPEVVCDGKRQIRLLHKDSVAAVVIGGPFRVVEKVCSRTTIRASRVAGFCAPSDGAAGRSEVGTVVRAGSDRTVSGKSLHCEVVSLEIDSHAARDRENTIDSLVICQCVVRGNYAIRRPSAACRKRNHARKEIIQGFTPPP